MIEVFGKKPVTSREFPAVLFDAGGTLMHLMPPVHRFYREHLLQMEVTISLEEMESAWIRMLSHLNRLVETDSSWYPPDDYWPHALLEALAIDETKRDSYAKALVEASKALRWVIAADVIDFCETLVERGYRLGVVSNASQDLSEVFRVQGILDLFEVIITANQASRLRKPQPHFFLEAADDLDLPPEQIIHVGESFALDVVGAQRAGMKAVLYDPTFQELKALAETTNETFSKVVSIETLRQNRRLSGVKVITKMDDLLSFFL